MDTRKYFAPSIVALSLALGVGVYMIAERANETQGPPSTVPPAQLGGTRVSAPLHSQDPGARGRPLELQFGASTAGITTSPTFDAKPRERLTLTLRNSASADIGQEHNFVLTHKSKVSDVTEQALQAGPQKSYIPDSEEVLAFIPLVGPGNSASITFTAPERPGVYVYICTFPGHAAGEVGYFRVKG